MKVIVQKETTKRPITLIGKEAGICWGADVTNEEKNYNRGLSCIESNHGRTLEFPQIYLIIDGISARLGRELYTHIAGSPTRLQASTRYIDYGDFDYIIPEQISQNKEALKEYCSLMIEISKTYLKLQNLGISNEDIANILPLGMTTKIVLRTNLRHLIDMMKVRQCQRAYWEFRELMEEIKNLLSSYSQEWKYITDNYMPIKCEEVGFCIEEYSCGYMPSKHTK